MAASTASRCSLPEFEGPFDLLLGLIAKHKLDVTTLALSKVTDEFIAYIRAMGADWDLDQATEFLVVAATLLDLKAARLLPAAEVEDEEDLALLEARDLLFARLLQYRAYKQVATELRRPLRSRAAAFPRAVGLEPQHAELLPEVVHQPRPRAVRALAVKAMTPRPCRRCTSTTSTPARSASASRRQRDRDCCASWARPRFGELCADAPDTLTVVARFLACWSCSARSRGAVRPAGGAAAS